MSEPVYFEALETRSLLSAPVATVESFRVTADTMTIVVHYAADNPINAATIGTGDIGVTGPNGLARLAASVNTATQLDGSIRATYLIRSGAAGAITPSHQMWFNGRYNLGIPGNSVRASDGSGNAPTGAGSYYFWFPDTVIETVNTLATDGWNLTLTRWNRNSQPVTTGLFTQVRITSPSGARVVDINGTYSGFGNTITSHVENVDGLWDYSDTGNYAIAVGSYIGTTVAGFQANAGYYLWFTNPKIEIISSVLDRGVVTLTARFSDDHAIDRTTIRWSTISLSTDSVNIPPTIDLYLTKAVQPDGSVIATFKRGVFGRDWTNRESGAWTWKTTVSTIFRDVDGNAANIGTIGHEQHTFTTLFTCSAAETTNPANPHAFSVSFDINTRDVDMTTLGNGDVRLDINGQSYTLSLVGTSSGTDLTTITYSLTLPPEVRLDSGTASVFLSAGAVGIGGGTNPEQLLGAWDLAFA